MRAAHGSLLPLGVGDEKCWSVSRWGERPKVSLPRTSSDKGLRTSGHIYDLIKTIWFHAAFGDIAKTCVTFIPGMSRWSFSFLVTTGNILWCDIPCMTLGETNHDIAYSIGMTLDTWLALLWSTRFLLWVVDEVCWLMPRDGLIKGYLKIQLFIITFLFDRFRVFWI